MAIFGLFTSRELLPQATSRVNIPVRVQVMYSEVVPLDSSKKHMWIYKRHARACVSDLLIYSKCQYFQSWYFRFVFVSISHQKPQLWCSGIKRLRGWWTELSACKRSGYSHRVCLGTRKRWSTERCKPMPCCKGRCFSSRLSKSRI